MSAIVVLFLILNFGISWFNAWSVGRSWAETKVIGGLARFMAWCGAVMSASGFTWCYLVLVCLIGQAIPGKYHLPDKYALGVMHLGYLIIILPVIGSGLAITIQSWAYFWRERSFKNGAITGWNTFAQAYNTYTAIRTIPESVSFLGDLFSSDSKSKDKDDLKGKLMLLVIVLVVLCVIGGILTTTAIIRATAKGEALQQSYRAKRAGMDDRLSQRWDEQHT